MKKISLYIIIFLLVVIILQRIFPKKVYIEGPPEIHTEYVLKDTVIYKDSIIYKVKDSLIPVTEYVDTTIYKYIDVDTNEIIANYFTKKFYCDTIINDTSMFVVVKDSVYNNSIVYRGVEGVNNRKTEIKVNVVNPPRVKLYAGFSLSSPLQPFLDTQSYPIGISPCLYLSSKKDALYGLGYDIINKRVQFSMLWKIKFNNKYYDYIK